MKIGDQNVQRTLRKKKVSGLLQEIKGPWDQCGDQGSYSPRPAPARPAIGHLGESWVNRPLPCQTRLEQHCESPGCLKSQGGNKDKVVNTRRPPVLAEESLKSGLVWSWPRQPPAWLERWAVWEDRPFLVQREPQDWPGGFFQKRKRPARALWGIPLQQQLQSPLHMATNQGTMLTSSQR